MWPPRSDRRRRPRAWRSPRRGGACGLSLLLAILLAGCIAACASRTNPQYCDTQRLCPAGFSCVRNRCERGDGAAGDANGGSGGGDGAADRDGGDAPDAPDSGDGLDAPGTCKAKEDCPSSRPCVAGKCVECETDGQCALDPSRSFCRTNTCVGCGAAGMGACVARSPAAPVCAAAGICVECEADAHCTRDAGKSFCRMNACVGCGAAGAGACAARSPATPICAAVGICVECETDAHCTKDAGKSFCRMSACVGCSAAGAGACAMRSPAAPVCDPADGTCVECLSSGDCTADAKRPICDGAARTCKKCTSDPECATKGGGPGVCMSHQDGRCASEGETIYVEKKAGCSDSGPGDVATPLCAVQAAQGKLTPTRRLVIVRGGVAGFSWSASGSATPITLVGQSSAIVAGGVDIGIKISGSGIDLLVRDVAISSSIDVGIVADGGATIRLDRVTVQNNAKGGLKVTGGSRYEVVNSIFDGNGPGLVGPTPFGGAYLASSGGGRFDFNTVVNNKQLGVACETTGQAITASILYANIGGDAPNCTVSSSRTTTDGDPMLTATYRLTAASPCRNAVASAPADAPVFDIDGESRPQEGKYDCGADEYVP